MVISPYQRLNSRQTIGESMIEVAVTDFVFPDSHDEIT